MSVFRGFPYKGNQGINPPHLQGVQDLIKPIQTLKPISQSELDRAEIEAKKLELETALALEKLKQDEQGKKFSYIKNSKMLFDKLTSNPLIIGIVLVAGYFAYKKLK